MLPPFDDDELIELPDLPEFPGLNQVMAEAIAAMRRDMRDPDPKVALHAARTFLNFYTKLANTAARDAARSARRKTVYVYVHPPRETPGRTTLPLPPKNPRPGS